MPFIAQYFVGPCVAERISAPPGRSSGRSQRIYMLSQMTTTTMKTQSSKQRKPTTILRRSNRHPTNPGLINLVALISSGIWDRVDYYVIARYDRLTRLLYTVNRALYVGRQTRFENLRSIFYFSVCSVGTYVIRSRSVELIYTTMYAYFIS